MPQRKSGGAAGVLRLEIMKKLREGVQFMTETIYSSSISGLSAAGASAAVLLAMCLLPGSLAASSGVQTFIVHPKLINTKTFVYLLHVHLLKVR